MNLKQLRCKIRWAWNVSKVRYEMVFFVYHIIRKASRKCNCVVLAMRCQQHATEDEKHYWEFSQFRNVLSNVGMLIFSLILSVAGATYNDYDYDVVVYGSTPAGTIKHI